MNYIIIINYTTNNLLIVQLSMLQEALLNSPHGEMDREADSVRGSHL
jgi:hypothetical protein